MKVVVKGGHVDTYIRTSLQFKNTTGEEQWPVEFEGDVARTILLSIMEDNNVICEVDFGGHIRLLGGKTTTDVIRLMALILGYQKEDFFKHFNTKEEADGRV